MKYLYLLLILTLFQNIAYNQIINTEFGKNRVQYHDDFNTWFQYETKNFITYWYGKSKNIGIPTSHLAEAFHYEIQQKLEHRINDKIEILVYTDLSDLKQSNIGTEEAFVNRTGETKIVGNMMFVYFDGNYTSLLNQIKSGIASVYFSNMMFGSTFQEIVQNAVLLDIPDWYKNGLIEYMASDWDLKAEAELRDIWAQYKNHRFSSLAEEHPKLIGQSFWYYVSQNYGMTSISNLLYLTKISRGIQNSFEYILGEELSSLQRGWEKYFHEYYGQEKGYFEPIKKDDIIPIKTKNKKPLQGITISSDRKWIAYVSNELGKIRIYVKNLEDNHTFTALKLGYKNYFQETDFNYPLIQWHPSKPELTIVFEKKDILYLRKLNVESKEKIEQTLPTDIDRVYSITYMDDLDYVFSGMIDGFSDIIYYKSKNRNVFKLTDDFYSDLDVSKGTYQGMQGIFMSSNRTLDTLYRMPYDTILPIQKYDVYFLPVDGPTKQNKAYKITSTPNVDERRPIQKQNNIYYLSNKNGVSNIWQKQIETSTDVAVTNFSQPVVHYDIDNIANTYLAIQKDKGRYFALRSALSSRPISLKTTQAYDYLTKNTAESTLALLLSPDQESIRQDTSIVQPGFMFQSEYSDPEILPTINRISKNTTTVKPKTLFNIPSHTMFLPKSVEPYDNTRTTGANKRFSLFDVTTTMNNDILFEGLESYTGDRQELINMPLGILLKASIKDLFEDYTFEGGVRIPTTFNGSEYFLVFNNKKHRIDKRIALYRRSNEYNSELFNNVFTRSKKTTLLGMYQLRYPFDIYRSVRATTILRFDRFIQLSTENQTFQSEPIHEKRLSLRVEYIYDNTHDVSLNIKNGTRYKIFVEAINQFNMEFIDGFNIDLNKGFTGIIGYDFRHYIPLFKRSVLALRAAGATSLGSKKMLYYIGGVENSIFPSFDQNTPQNQDLSYAYKVNAFHLRGFDNNIRNGGTFMLTNAELRIPIMQYILGKNRGIGFLRYLQIVGFFDTGLAWYGTSPYGSLNPLNKITLTSPPVLTLEVEYFRDPLVMGYGVGLRTQLFGYFVKFDYARGIETRTVQPAKYYLSFGADF